MLRRLASLFRSRPGEAPCQPHGDVPRVPKPLRTAEPEHSHRSALAGRRPELGIFSAGNACHHRRVIGDD